MPKTGWNHVNERPNTEKSVLGRFFVCPTLKEEEKWQKSTFSSQTERLNNLKRA